jgi:hypothetical protein
MALLKDAMVITYDHTAVERAQITHMLQCAPRLQITIAQALELAAGLHAHMLRQSASK